MYKHLVTDTNKLSSSSRCLSILQRPKGTTEPLTLLRSRFQHGAPKPGLSALEEASSLGSFPTGDAASQRAATTPGGVTGAKWRRRGAPSTALPHAPSRPRGPPHRHPTLGSPRSGPPRPYRGAAPRCRGRSPDRPAWFPAAQPWPPLAPPVRPGPARRVDAPCRRGGGPARLAPHGGGLGPVLAVLRSCASLRATAGLFPACAPSVR